MRLVIHSILTCQGRLWPFQLILDVILQCTFVYEVTLKYTFTSVCFLFSIREARTPTAAIGVARLALRALEGKMASAILSSHVLPSQVSIPAFGQTASQKFGAYGKALAVVTEYKLSL